MIDIFQDNPALYYIVVGIVSLAVGSFLNVLIYRLPLMLQKQWQIECDELNGKIQETEQDRFNLLTPASKCPHCGHKIRAWENIPVISYLFLKARCSACKEKISVRYPIIESLTAIMSVIVAIHFGVSIQAVFAIFLTWTLISLSMIDFDHQILPDNMTLPVLWLGLLLSLSAVFTNTTSALIGAAAGYLSLWSVFWLFKLLTGKEGMGYGDFKLLALFGAWLGWQYIPQIILLSSIVGAIIGISMILTLGRDKNIPIPFGPYLAIAGWISLLWGEEINHSYLQFAGLG